MPHTKRHWAWGIILAFCLSPFGFTQDNSPTQSLASAPSDEASLRVVVEKFFTAYGKKDLAGVLALWSEKSPDFATHRQSLEQLFITEDLSFGSPALSRVKVEGEKASLRVTLEFTAINLKSKQTRAERLVRNFGLVKEGGEWKVWRYSPAVNDLAEALVKAKSEAEQTGLLAEEKELVTAELARALISQGNRFLNQGSYPQALAVFRLAQSIGEQIGDKAEIVNALNSIGAVYYQQGNYAQALEHYQESLTSGETLGDKALIARALHNIGAVHESQDNYVKAVEYYQKSLGTREALGDKDRVARTLNNIGIVHSKQGNYAQALEHYQKSLAIFEAIGNKAGIALALNNIGLDHYKQGNYVQALEYLQKGLAMFEASGSKTGLALPLVNIGMIHDAQGDYVKALEYYQKSLAMFEAFGDKAGIAVSLSNIGHLHSRQDNYVHALEYLQKSLAMREALGSKAGIASTLDNIGHLHSRQGNYAQALEFFRKSLAMREALGNKAGIARTLKNIGFAHEKQGHYSQSLEFAERAAALARQPGGIETLWRARLTAGTAYRALNQPAKARQAFDEAITTIETMRAQVAGGEQEQQRFFESKVSPYHAMVELLIAQNNTAEALTYAEHAKSRVLLDVLYSGRINVTKAMTGEEQEQERKLNNLLVSLNAQIYRESLRQQPDQARLAELKSQLQKARLEFEAFETSLYAAHPELKTQRGAAQPLRLEEASALLPDAKTALLEFVVAEEKTYLFVLTKQTTAAVKVYPLEIKQKDLTDRVERFRQMISTLDNRFSGPARELYDLLLKPAAEQLRGKTRLVIVPDGPLWELPFQALRTPLNRYLIEDQTILYVPSLTVLREMIKSRGKEAKSFATPTLLALGNPALGKETLSRVKAVLMDERLDPLPEAERQVRTLGRMYGSSRSKVYVGAEAREERFKSEAGDYRILHLATHGILNDRSPMYSYVLLAQTGETGKEDGLLEAWELMKLDLKADLAVLSACETARGRVGKGEGMIGLTWALFVAGVPATVVSQWKVRSDSTTELMVEFHRRLKTRPAGSPSRKAVAEALREAALKLTGDRRYRHPFHWAGFVVVGDGY